MPSAYPRQKGIIMDPGQVTKRADLDVAGVEVELGVEHAAHLIAAIGADLAAAELLVEPQHHLDVVRLVLLDAVNVAGSHLPLASVVRLICTTHMWCQPQYALCITFISRDAAAARSGRRHRPSPGDPCRGRARPPA